jgi:hypothetical protein
LLMIGYLALHTVAGITRAFGPPTTVFAVLFHCLDAERIKVIWIENRKGWCNPYPSPK